MILRIVRMEFQKDKIEEFRQLFDHYKYKIRSTPGCLHLELHCDPLRPEVLFTYSHWEGLESLEAYRHSDTFQEVWPQTKALFAARPQAFSLEKVEEIPSTT